MTIIFLDLARDRPDGTISASLLIPLVSIFRELRNDIGGAITSHLQIDINFEAIAEVLVNR